MPRRKSNHPLRLWLRAVDKTPAEFARELAVDRSYISRVISGERKPRRLLKAIADKTGIPFAALQTWAA